MADAPRPLISVVIPTRNRAELLRHCLDLLAPGAQTLDASQYEVIVSDDGDAGSARRALAADFPWVRFVEGPRRGPAANRNTGAREARGRWIAFTDDDTEPAPHWLATFSGAMTDGITVYEGRTTCDGGFGSPLYHAPENLIGGRLWSCNVLVDAAAFTRTGGFDEAFVFPHMEDQDLRVRLHAAGERMLFVRDAVVNHPPRRQPDGSRLGAYREAEVRYMYKHGARRPVRAELYEKIVRYRLGVIRNTPKSFDSVIALWSLARELWYVATHIGGWERTSAREFPA
jgi:GT2 family glycosyltransferase